MCQLATRYGAHMAARLKRCFKQSTTLRDQFKKPSTTQLTTTECATVGSVTAVPLHASGARKIGILTAAVWRGNNLTKANLIPAAGWHQAGNFLITSQVWHHLQSQKFTLSMSKCALICICVILMLLECLPDRLFSRATRADVTKLHWNIRLLSNFRHVRNKCKFVNECESL